MNDEDTKPIRNYRNERCVFCGGKTVILFHQLRWCPDCEKKEKEGFEWPEPGDDSSFFKLCADDINAQFDKVMSGMYTPIAKELQKFRDSFKISRCPKHNSESCAWCITNK